MTQFRSAISAFIITAVALISEISWAAIPKQYLGFYALEKCTSDGGPNINLCKQGPPLIVLISENRIIACKSVVGLDDCESELGQLWSLRVPPPPPSATGSTVRENSGTGFWHSVVENPRYSRSIQIQEFGKKLIKLTLKEECSEQSKLCDGLSRFEEIWLKPKIRRHAL